MVEDFMAEAGAFTVEADSAAVGSTAAEDFMEAEGSEVVVFAAAEVSAEELSVAAGFEVGPVFAEEALAVAFVAASVVTASGGASVSADADGAGEVGAGVGA